MISLSADQRRRLGAFLRSHREALTPTRPAGSRTRTPGWRREEVAALCGVSTTWYTWIEQGREIAVSAQALARLAEALRLTPAERAYAFGLAGRLDPAVEDAASAGPTPSLVAALDAITAPAYCLDRLWVARGFNAGARHLFAPWIASGEACLLRWVFLDPQARRFIVDWPERARRLAAEFRADTARHPQDTAMQELVSGLRAASGDFDRVWADQAVLAREGGLRRFVHAQDGALAFEQLTVVPAVEPDCKLVLLLPR